MPKPMTPEEEAELEAQMEQEQGGEEDPTAEEGEPDGDEEEEEEPYRKPMRKAAPAPRRAVAAEPSNVSALVDEDVFKSIIDEAVQAQLAPLFNLMKRQGKQIEALGVTLKALGTTDLTKSVETPATEAVEPVVPALDALKAAPVTSETPDGKGKLAEPADSSATLNQRADTILSKAMKLTRDHRKGFARFSALEGARRYNQVNEAIIKSLADEIDEFETVLAKSVS